MNKNEETPKELFEIFWKDLVTNEDGSINQEKLENELADFYFMMKEVPKVYLAITGDSLSKPMYKADTVINAANEYYQKEAVESATEMFDYIIELDANEVYSDEDKQQIINMFF